MVLGGTAIDAYIIMYHDNARENVCCLFHSHLKDGLGHFRPKGIYRNLYLPQSVLNVVRYEDFSSKWIPQKPSLVSSLLKHVAPLRQ